MKNQKKWFSGLKIFFLVCIFSFNMDCLTYTQGIMKDDAILCKAKQNTPSELRQLYAKSACLMDGDSGRILFEKNGNDQKPMASTTKILTCIITLENAKLDDIVTISKNAARQPDVQLNAREKEQFILKNLLYSLMLESHNDSAVAIAEHIGGTVENFATIMNQKAMDIGCQKFHFVTPNGLDSSDQGGEHSISACDLAKILRYCIKVSPKKDKFLEITRTSNVTFSNHSGSRRFSCRNHNAYLTMNKDAITGKTGFTGKAGYCYVGAVENGKRTFIVALQACGWPNNRTYKWSDMKKLVRYGSEHYQFYDILKNKKQLKSLIVENGIPQNGYLRKKPITRLVVDYGMEEHYSMLLKEDEKPQSTIELPEKLMAPVKAGDAVGKITYWLNNEEIVNYTIYASNTVGEFKYTWCLKQVINVYLFGKNKIY